MLIFKDSLQSFNEEVLLSMEMGKFLDEKEIKLEFFLVSEQKNRAFRS